MQGVLIHVIDKPSKTKGYLWVKKVTYDTTPVFILAHKEIYKMYEGFSITALAQYLNDHYPNEGNKWKQVWFKKITFKD